MNHAWVERSTWGVIVQPLSINHESRNQQAERDSSRNRRCDGSKRSTTPQESVASGCTSAPVQHKRLLAVYCGQDPLGEAGRCRGRRSGGAERPVQYLVSSRHVAASWAAIRMFAQEALKRGRGWFPVVPLCGMRHELSLRRRLAAVGESARGAWGGVEELITQPLKIATFDFHESSSAQTLR
jgi:hypothetical protein